MLNSVVLIIVVLNTTIHQAEFAYQRYEEAIDSVKRGEYSKAKELFLHALNINPYYFKAHYGYGRLCLITGDVENAMKHLSIAVQLDTSSASAWFYLGFAYFFAKQYMRANTCFIKAYSIDNTFIESLYNSAVIYEITGNKYKSQKMFERYVAEKKKVEEGILF